MNWISVKKSSPCQICERSDWCSRSRDGEVAICRRQGGVGAFEKTDKAGGVYWVHPRNPSAPRRQAPQLPPAPQPERASPYELDTVYRALLRRLPLEQHHLRNLRDRGLSDNDIQRLSYRSIPEAGVSRIIKNLVDEIGEDLIAKTPGFYVAEGRYGPFWTLNSGAGIVVQIRSIDCEIVALKVRLDTTGKSGRFIYLSSTKHDGPGPLTGCHVPVFTKSRNVIRLTEGPMKADISTALSGTLTLGLPDCGQWKLALPVLEQLQPELVLLAWDSDWRTNSKVSNGLSEGAKGLNRKGFKVQVEDWCPSEAKGIDDLYAAGKRPQRKPWQYALVAKHRGMERKVEHHA